MFGINMFGINVFVYILIFIRLVQLVYTVAQNDHNRIGISPYTYIRLRLKLDAFAYIEHLE